MQGSSDQQVTRSRYRLMALSILTSAALMLAVQVHSAAAASVSSFKVAKLVGSKHSGGKRTDSHMINAWGLAFIAADDTGLDRDASGHRLGQRREVPFPQLSGA